LDELEQRLTASGALIVAAFRPGAPADEVRAVIGRRGSMLTPTSSIWWGWHDGVALADAPRVLSGPGVYLRSENTLVEDWRRRLYPTHTEDPRVPGFDAAARKGDLRRLSYW